MPWMRPRARIITAHQAGQYFVTKREHAKILDSPAKLMLTSAHFRSSPRHNHIE